VGLDIDCIRFLHSARGAGASFERTLTLGRQNLGHATRIERLLGVSRPSGADVGFAEWALSGLGGKVESIDASGYEGATHIHDFNTPVPPALAESYDVRQALLNMMTLTRVGGSVFLFTPGNNAMGHGFYQFSPELFYRVFSRENGFRVVRCLVQPLTVWRRTYAALDPAVVGERVGAIHSAPIRMFVHAVRESRADLFSHPVQQSDYSAAWQPEQPTSKTSARVWKRRVYDWMDEHAPPAVRDAMYQWYFRAFVHTLRNRKLFRPEPL
jgi:hypothetical protein